MARPKNPGGNAGKGRIKGSQNKFTKEVKGMILAALDQAGGVDYLARQADANPSAFMALVGKVLPLQLGGDPSNPLIHEVRRTIVRP